MIIIKESGGLGNQMFQYAYGRKVALRANEELKLDTSTFTKKDLLAFQKDTARPFLLGHFNIKAEIATQKEINTFNSFISRLWKKIKGKLFGHPHPYQFNTSELNVSNNSYKEGFWQREEYFSDLKEILTQEFSPKGGFGENALLTIKKIEEIRVTEYTPIALHVRRGDYTKKTSGFDCASIEYYKKALVKLDEKVWGKKTFFVFSDDVPWAEEHIVPLLGNHNAVLMNPNEVSIPEELLIMSYCSHFIISNSTFSWWSAWLREKVDTVIIAPHQWSQTAAFPNSPVPERWCTIKV